MNYRKENVIYDRVVRQITDDFRDYVEQDYGQTECGLYFGERPKNGDKGDDGEDWDSFKEEAFQILYNHDIDYPVEEDYSFLVFFLCVVKEHSDANDKVEWDNPQKIVNLGYYYIAQEIFGDFEKEEFVDTSESEEEEEDDIVFYCDSCKKGIVRDSEDHDFSKSLSKKPEEKWYCVDCHCEEEEERYCDNADCPYEGFCCLEVLEEHKGKPYICKGCSTGIGVQEEEVRCVCPKCFAEGYTFVSKERAKELKELKEMEEMCPFGEKCTGDA